MTEEKSRIIRSINEMRLKKNGSKAWQILEIITYFATKNIGKEILLNILSDEKELETAIRLLKEYSLIYSGKDETLINISNKVQKVMAEIMKSEYKEFQVLFRAFGMFNHQGIGSNYLDHAISVWDHASSYPPLIECHCSFPRLTIIEFTKHLRYKEGVAFGWKALDLLNRTLERDHKEISLLRHHMGLLLVMAGKQEKAFEILWPFFDNNIAHPALRETLSTMATQLREYLRFDEALKLYEQNIFRNTKVSHANNLAILGVWHDYALLLSDMGKYSEASKLLEGILKRKSQISNVEDDDTLSLQSSLGRIFVVESKYSEAMNIFCNVLGKRIDVLGPAHASTLRTHRDIAFVFQHQGKFADALAILENLTKKFIEVYGSEHLETLALQAQLAHLFEQEGEYERALETFRYIHNKHSQILGKKHADTLEVKHRIAQILLILKKHDEALNIFQEVYRAYIDVHGPNHLQTVALKNLLETLNSVNLETIYSSAWEGNLNKIKSIIQNGIDINSTDFHNKSALHYAAERGHTSVVKFLLKKGAIYNSENREGKTPVQMTKNSETKNLLTLVAKCIKDAKEGNHKQLSKDIGKVKEIVNAKDNDGSSALHWATHNGHKDIVKLLLENGADAMHVTNKGNTPLHIATSKGHEEIVEILLQSVGHNNLHNFINAKTAVEGVTSIHVAAKNSFSEIVKSLMKHGAIYNIKNKKGETPLDVSQGSCIIALLKLSDELFQNAKNGSNKIINKLQHVESDEFLALTNTRNDEGITLLQVLVTNKHKNIASQFLEMVKKPDRTKTSLNSHEYTLDQIERFKRAAELHIRFSKVFLYKLEDITRSEDLKKNSPRWATLMEGSFYLEKVYQLVEECKSYMNGSLDNNDIQAINTVLLELGFDRKHITVGYTPEAYDGRVECFVSEGQGTKYYELLHSELKRDVRSFGTIADLKISAHVKKFLEFFNQKLKYFASERLFKVIENDNYLEVEGCIRDGANINSKNKDGVTPLHYAANQGNSHIVNELLKYGADIFQVTTKGNTPLHIATAKGHKKVVEVILQHASCNDLNDFVNYQTTVGNTTSLHVAAKNGSIDIVISLLKYGAIFDIKNREGKQPLELSQVQNIIDLLQLIEKLFRGVEIGSVDIIDEMHRLDELEILKNVRNNQSNTLLQVAVINKHENIENILSEIINKRDETKRLTCLESKMCRLERLKYRAELHLEFSNIYLPKLRNMSRPYERAENIAAWVAVKEGSYFLGNAYSLVRAYKESVSGFIDDKDIQAVNDILIELQYDPKYNTSGYTDEAYGGTTKCFVSKGQGTKYYELLHSEYNRDVKLFVEMVERDIDVHVKKFLESVKEKLKYDVPEKLFKAIERDNQSEVERCIREGVDINSKNSDGDAPLHCAIINGNLNIINYLLKNGADVTRVSDNGYTALHIAVSKNLEKIVEFILEHARRNELIDFVNARTVGYGDTSLHIATKNNFEHVALCLLKYGAIFNVKNRAGETPLHFSDGHLTYLFVTVEDLFLFAEIWEDKVVHELRYSLEPDDFIAITNARNLDGCTIIQLAIKNGYKKITGQFLKMFQHPGKNHSGSIPEKIPEQFEMLVEVAELHSRIYQLYLLELRSMLESCDSEKITSTSNALRDGFYYLRSAHVLVEFYKRCSNGVTDDENIRKINDTLTTLEFNPEYVTNDVSGEQDAFISKRRGNQYFNLLYSGLKEDVRLFIKFIECNIEVYVKNFLEKIEILQNISPPKFVEDRNRKRLNSKNAEGRTPLHYAAYKGNFRVVDFLIRNGADITEVTEKGNTPLHIATSVNSAMIVQRLLGCTRSDKLFDYVNAQTVGGNTSLHVAAKNGSKNIVECLLRHGAIYNMRNKKDETPLDLSTDQNVTDLLILVEEFFENAQNRHFHFNADKLGYLDIDKADKASQTARILALNTFLDISVADMHKNTAKIQGIRKGPDETRSSPVPKLSLNDHQNLKKAAIADVLEADERKDTVGEIPEIHAKANAVRAAPALKLGLNDNQNLKEAAIADVLEADERKDTVGKIPEIHAKANDVRAESATKSGLNDNQNLKEAAIADVLEADERKDTVGKIPEIHAKANEVRSAPAPKLGLNQIRKLREAAESCIKCSESYLPMLRDASQSIRSEKNSFPWATLKAGSYYLRGVHSLVEVYKECMHGSIEDTNIKVVNCILAELEFHPTHMTLGYTDEAFDGKVECFVSKGQGTKYYELLHSKLKKDVRSFLEIIQPDINIHVKQFIKSINHELPTVVSEILFRAVNNNNKLEVENCLKEVSAVINLKNNYGKTPLYYAVNNCNVSIINTLLKHGADVYRKDNQGHTPLHIASSKGNKKIVEILIRNITRDKLNDFVNAQSINGTTSLHLGAKNGFLEIVESLLKHGAIYNMKDKEGRTARDIAHEDDVVAILLNLIEELFNDAKNGNFNIIRRLKTQPFKFTALTNTRNDQGESLVQVAISNKHQSLAEKLELTLKS